MRKRKWWFAGLALALLAACAGVWKLGKTESPLPPFLRGFEARTELMYRRTPHIDNPGTVTIIEWYKTDVPAEDVIVSLVDQVGMTRVHETRYGVASGDHTFGYGIHPARIGDMELTYVQKWELRPLARFDSWLGSKWPGWLSFRLGAGKAEHMIELPEVLRAERAVDFRELRKRRPGLFHEPPIGTVFIRGMPVDLWGGRPQAP